MLLKIIFIIILLVIYYLIHIFNIRIPKKIETFKYTSSSSSKFIYLIGGLPRCRTAWMSVALSYLNSICLHEPIKHFIQSPHKLKSFVFQYFKKGFKYVGISCSSIYRYRNFYKKIFPFAKFIFIQRNKTDILHSLHKLNLYPDKKIFHVSTSFFDYVIKYEDIDNIQHFKKLWLFLYKNHIPFDPIRFKDLSDIHISIIKKKWEKNYGTL